MPKGQRTGESTIARMRDLRRSGSPVDTIANELKVSKETVIRYTKDLGGKSLGARPLPPSGTVMQLPGGGSARFRDDGSAAVLMSAEQMEGLLGPERAMASVIMTESLKRRILLAVATKGPFATLNDLVTEIRTPTDNWDKHEAASMVHQLRKQGSVKADVRKSGVPTSLGGGELVHIEATPAGRQKAGVNDRPAMALEHPRDGNRPPGWSRQKHAVGKDYTEERYHGTVAEGSEVITMVAVPVRMGEPSITPEPPQTVPEPEPTPAEPPAQPVDTAVVTAQRRSASDVLAQFPAGRALLQRRADREAAADKATAYIKAAEAIIAFDEPEATRLMEMASTMEGTPFTDVEEELVDALDMLADLHR